MKTLAPPEKLLWKAQQGKISHEEYRARYLEAIERQYTPASLLEALAAAHSDRDIVLLCFEKKETFCHRRVLAEWLKGAAQTEIEEL